MKNYVKQLMGSYQYYRQQGLLPPWYILAWRIFWIIPAFAARVLFVLFIGIAFGYHDGARTWRDTA